MKAMVLTGPAAGSLELHEREIPMVLINPADENPGVPRVSVDDEAATEPLQQSAPFDRLGLSAAMRTTVAEMGFTIATPIQAGAMAVPRPAP